MLLRIADRHPEVLEYLKRDIANLALGNTDNHARNDAGRPDRGRVLERIASEGLDLGLEPEVLDHLRQSLHARARELTALR
ncbi:MAG: hypothetical protein RIS35_1191 [Pseudomonadota bacterium]|jgi:hypothetical protein